MAWDRPTLMMLRCLLYKMHQKIDSGITASVNAMFRSICMDEKTKVGFCRRLSLIRYVCDRTSKGSKGSHIKLTGDSDVKDINKVLYLMPHHENIILRSLSKPHLKI